MASEGKAESSAAPTRKGMSGFKKALLIFFLILVGGGALSFSYLYYGSYSEGTRKGYLMKLSKKGYVFKTWEGQLDIGGLSAGGAAGNVPTSVWEFSIDDHQQDVILELQKELESNERNQVQLTYEEKLVKFSWRGDTQYFITGVKRLGKNGELPPAQQPQTPSPEPEQPSQEVPAEEIPTPEEAAPEEVPAEAGEEV